MMPRWFSVDECLSMAGLSPGDTVLVYMPYAKSPYQFAVAFEEDGEWWDNFSDVKLTQEVTHWSPLIAPEDRRNRLHPDEVVT